MQWKAEARKNKKREHEEKETQREGQKNQCDKQKMQNEETRMQSQRKQRQGAQQVEIANSNPVAGLDHSQEPGSQDQQEINKQE